MQTPLDEGNGRRTTIAEAVVQVRGLSLSYRRGLVRPLRVEALRSIDFEACAGEIVGVVGPNGSGKSSLFRSLLGLEQARGTARLFDKSPGDRTLRRRIGSSSDEGLPFPEFSASEYLTLHAVLTGRPMPEARQRSAEMLERVGLQLAGRRRHGEFSSGMAQRLSLAQALLHEPDLLLLDEPTANLDPLGVEIVVRELRAFGERGGCALVATHGLEDYGGLFSRLLVLLEGRRVAFGTPDEVLGTHGRFELRLEGHDAELLTALRTQAEGQGLEATRLGPLHRSLGHLLADVQATSEQEPHAP